MIRFSQTILMLGVATIALAACSGTKGPGAIGTKDDIKVTSRGLPGEKVNAEPPPSAASGDFSSTIEQAEAVPAAEVAAAEPLPDTSPAMEEAVAAQDAADAPMPSPAAVTPPDASTASPAETRPIDAVVPTEPVTEAAVAPPPSEPAPVASTQPSSVYPAEDYAQAAQQQAALESAPAAVPAPAPAPAAATPHAYVPAPSGYQPEDPNAPYSPRAAAAAASSSAPAAGVTNFSDPAVISAVQKAMKEKGAYTGLVNGKMDSSFLNALVMFQVQNKLPQGGLNEATLRALGVIQ